MADKYGYEPITSAPVLTAEEIARRNIARSRQEAARKEEAEKRRLALIAEAKRQAAQKKRPAPDENEDRPRSRPSTFSTVPDAITESDIPPKTVKVDDVEMPLDEAVAKIPEQMDFEEFVRQPSPLTERALARARTEELTAGGMAPEKAAEQARQEREKRQAAFERGREAVRKEPATADKEGRGFAESVTSGVGAPIARMLGFGQAANEAEARAAGVQAELSQFRDERYAHPQIAGAVAGAAQNTAQMGPGIAASMLGGPAVGMAVMSGQFGSQEYSRAAYEGAEAGLAGAELNQYALIQAGVEASIMPIMSKIPGMAGIEGRVLRQSVARGVAAHPTIRKALSGAGTLAKDTAAEVTEEVITEVLHGFASEGMLNEDVDYKAVIGDTVLQTLVMMGMTEGVTQAGRLMDAGRKSQPELTQPDPQTQQYETPVLKNPAIDAFIANPGSAKLYEAAVASGMAPLPNPNRTERRKYAAGLKQLSQDPAPQPELQNEASSAEMPPAVETPSGMVPDGLFDELLNLYEGSSTNGHEANITEAQSNITNDRVSQEGRQEGEQGRQEGLLVPQETPSGTEGMTAAASPNDSTVPAATTREDFEKEYRDTFREWMKYPPDQAGHTVYRDKMADLYDAHPDWADEIENTLPKPEPQAEPAPDQPTPPELASGELSPVQSAPSLAEPVSKQPSLNDLRSTFKQQRDRLDAEFDAETKAMGAKKSRARTRAEKDRLDQEWRVRKDAFDGKKQRMFSEQREILEAHPERIAERQETAEAAQRIQDEGNAESVAKQERVDADRIQEIVQAGGFTSVKDAIGKQISDLEVRLKRSAERNKWKIESNLNNRRKELETVERLESIHNAQQEATPVATGVPSPDQSSEEAGPVSKPSVPAFLALPQKSQDLFNKAFESKDVESLKQMVAKNNVAWNKEFENRTGIKLPRSLKDRHQAVLDWIAPLAKPEPPAVSGKRSDLPMWGVYPTLFQGKPKFAVKESDKGFGDALFDSEAEAKEYADTGRQRAAERAEREAKNQAAEEADQKKQQEHEASFQGFLTDDPKTKGRRLKTLDSSLNYKNKPTTRKTLVEQKVADGWTVNDKDQLQAPTGEFLDERDLTKTGIDYARHLVSKQRDSGRDKILAAVKQVNPRVQSGDMVSIADIRAAVGMEPAEFDATMQHLVKDKVLAAHRFDRPGMVSDEQKQQMLKLGDSWHNTVSLWENEPGDRDRINQMMDDAESAAKPAAPEAPATAPEVKTPKPKTEKPEKTLQGQTLLPGMTGRAEEIDRNEFVRKHQSRLLEDVRDIVDDEGMLDALRLPVGNILKAIWNGELEATGDVFSDTDRGNDLWTALTSVIAYHAPSRREAVIENLADQAITQAFANRDAIKPKSAKSAEPTESDIKAGVRAEIARQIAEEAAKKPAKTPAVDKGSTAKPKAPRKPRTKTGEKLGKLSEDTGADAKQAFETWLKAVKGMPLNSALGVFNPELAKMTVTMVRAQVKDKVVKFADLVARIAEWSSPEMARNLSDYIEAAWDILRETDSRLDETGKVSDVLGSEIEATTENQTERDEPAVSGQPPALALVESLEDELLKSRGIDAKRLWELADKAYGGTRAEGKYGPSEAYDALETAINLTILDARAMGLKTPAGQVSPEVALKNLLDMQKQIVSQTNRSGTKDTMQQFSTPPAYSYVVSQFVNMDARDVVLEPSAGTGDLAVHALNQRAKVHVNELDPKRAEMLKAVQESAEDRLTISTEDALQLGNIMGPNLRPSVVLMNPPFSREGQRMGDKKMSGNDRNHIDAAMASLIDGGRLVAIIGAGLHGPSKGFTNWLAETAKKHNVKANIEVSRDVYKGYGTTFPTRVLVIDKGTPTPKDGTLTAQADSLEHLLTMTKEIRNDRNRGSIQPVAPGQNVAGNAGTNEGGQQSKAPDSAGTAESGSGQPYGNTSDTTAKAPRRTSGTADPNVADDSGRRPDAADSKGTRSNPPAGSESAGGGTTDAAGEPTGNLAGQSPQPRRVGEKRTEIDDSVLFEPYQPSIVPFPNAKPHPTAAVESAAMSAVDYPEVTEVPNIDASIIEDGRLSDVQLEFVALAAHAHNQLLPSEERTGILFGDGTGMGKGRGIPGVILHNWNEGRRQAIWMSKNGKLHSDAMREWEELGGNPAQVANLSDMPVDNAIDLNEGILFATYDTLKSRGKSGKTRAQQVIDWLPKDFDGVIAFDEAHLMGSDTAARAGVARDIQDKFPKARVVYASATAATEIDQLMFASRLGLWGAATPFTTAREFANKIGSAGVAAMESVALSLKAMGRYVSRSISFNDGTPDGTVGYRRLNHPLADHQVQMYDRLAEAWQKVIGEFEDAMDATGADNFARGFARGQFWSAHQRFFNDLVTSLQMPTVIEAIEKDLAEGRSVVIQLTSTGGAQTTRALAGRGTQSLDDFAVDPFSSLVELVRSQFPTQAYEEYVKDDGSVGKRPVVDSSGKPVKDAAAVAAQQQLLSDLAEMESSMPDGPLDMILNYFGIENVAEVTGRNQRVVWQEQQDGTKKRVLEKRNQKKSGQADIDAFQEGKKRILVFSQAGGTGASYHADRRASNQQKRVHYLVQPGWVAANAIQGLGRTHRTNQKQAPEYVLVQTDIPGQKRFISTIARRLTQLGALTRGQRTAGGSGVFEASDNLESMEASLALTEFFKSLENEDSVMSLEEFEEQTGLELRLRSTGAMKSDVNLPDITSFMNRILSMKIESQNKVFDKFDRLLQNITEARRISGELDQGVETIKGGNIRKTRDEVVFTHDSGAKTRYVQLTMDIPVPSRDFEAIAKQERFTDFIGYYKRKSNNRVFFVNESFAKTTKSGRVVDMVRLVPPYGDTLREEAYTLAQGKLEKITRVEAESLWNEQYGNRPKTKPHTVDMITGAVLPVWDRLPQLQPKLSRALTAAGDMVLGVVLPPSKVNETLGKLGAEKNKVDVGETIKMLRTGKGDVQLVNGWMIQRARVQNEWRLEIIGPNPVSEQVFQRQGVIIERIGFRARYFIPFGENTQAVFDAVTRGNPVQKVNRYDSMDTGDDEEVDTEEPKAVDEPAATPEPATEPAGELRQAADKSRAELSALQLMNRQYDKVIFREVKKLVWGRGSTSWTTLVPINDELARAIVGRMVNSIKAGVKQFEVFIRELRASHSEETVRLIKDNVFRAWNGVKDKMGLDEATDIAFEAAVTDTKDLDIEQAVALAKGEAPEEMLEPQPEEPATDQQPTSKIPATDPDDEPTIGIKKAKRAERLQELGLEQEDIVNKIGHSFPELDADAKMVSPGEAEDVFTRIGEGAEAADNASDRDVFVMLNHYAKKQMATRQTQDELEAARESGDDFKVAELEAKLSVQVAEEVRLMAIAKSAGTASGRALAAFKALLKYDFSLARLRLRLDAAADGKPTEAQTREQMELHAKYEAALKELEAKTKEAEAATARAEIAEQIARDMEATASTGKTKADRRLEAAWKPFRKADTFFSVTGAFQMLPEFIELAGAHIEKGVETFSEFIDRLSKHFGRQPKPETVPVLQQAWDVAWDNEKNPKPLGPPKVSIEPDHPGSLVGAAKALFRFFLSQGITDTDAVIDAVHEELQNQFPGEIGERLDTMKAMVDYDKTRTLSQDPLDILAADKRAIVQLKAKIEDMKRGIAPRRFEQRYPVSDEQRAHIKMFNEEKRKGGFVVTDPDRQAKTALASLETRLRHSISDTLNEIASGARTVSEKTAAPTSDTIEDLQAYLALVRGMHKAIFGDRTMTQEQRLKAAEAAAVKNEAYWNERLSRAKAGDFSTGKTKPTPVTNATIDAIKARSELAKAQVQELKELANPKPDPEAISDARYLTSLEKQLAVKLARIADIMARAAGGDFAPERNVSKEKREANAQRRRSDANIRDARIKLDEATKALNEQIEQVKKKNLTYVDLALRVPGAAWSTLRDLKLTGELSFILRQGGPRVFGVMVPAGKIARAGLEALSGNTDAAKAKLKQAGQGYKQLGATLGRTLKAVFGKTDTELARSMDALRQRPNYKNGTYEAMRLSLHEDGSKFSVAEELFINNLVELGQLALDKRFPGFKGFRDGNPVFTKTAHNLNLANRLSNATKVFMNEMRADMADDAAALWTMKSGEMTPAEARSLGNVVNAFTGKGDMSLIGMEGKKAQNFLSKLLISAPWLMSRLQLLSGQPLWSKGRTPETQKAAAEMYVDMAAGVAAYYGAFILAGMFMADDDDERPVVEWDSTSSDFMKVRIGKTRMDPLFGLQQVIVLVSRILNDEIKDSRGVVRKRKGFEDDWALISRFQEGRLHPGFQDIRAFKTGKDFMGQPITKTEAAIGMVLPITYPAIAEASKRHGIPTSIAMGIWAIAGGGLATYDARTKARADLAEELSIVQRKLKNSNTPADVRKSLQADADAMIESHLVNAVRSEATNNGDTALGDQAASYKPGTTMSPELTEAIQKEKGDLVLRAAELLSTEDKDKKKKSPDDDKSITTARDLLKAVAPTYKEADKLYTEAYKRDNKSVAELVGPKGKKRYVVKKNVVAARRRLKAMYDK